MSVCVCVRAPAHLCTSGVHMASVMVSICSILATSIPLATYTHTAAYGIMWFLERKNLKNDLIL